MSGLVVGFPLYHQVPSSFFTRWLAIDQSPVIGTVTVDGAYLPVSMQTIVDRALDIPDWERLVVFEHDMIAPQDALVRISHYGPEHAVVGSMYFGHQEPHTAVCYIAQPDGTFSPITPQTVKSWCDDPGLHRCDAVGFGLTSIARHVLEDWNPDIPMFGINDRYGSHDIWFCDKAREQGYDVYIDSGLICDHLTQVPIGISRNQDCAYMIDGAKILDFEYAEA